MGSWEAIVKDKSIGVHRTSKNGGFSLAGLLLGQEEKLPSSC